MKLVVLLICLVTVCVSSVENAQLQDEDPFLSPLGRREMEPADQDPSPPSNLSEEPKLERSLLPVDVALSSIPSVKVTLPK
jgi:hypothetical protein